MRLTKLPFLLFKALFSKRERDYSRFVLADKMASFLYPKLTFSEFGRIWMKDQAFLDYYHKYVGTNYHSADRKYFLRSLLSLVDGLPGDTAECGAYQGASSWLMAHHIRGQGKTHHIFDSFEGISNPTARDGEYWTAGDLASSEEILKKNLAEYNITTYKGWIPDRFPDVSGRDFCFVHVDVDLYQPTHESISFFYPKVVSGGIILCDDYGFSTCPGAKQAFDEYMTDKPETIIHVPTGQGFVIKR